MERMTPGQEEAALERHRERVAAFRSQFSSMPDDALWRWLDGYARGVRVQCSASLEAASDEIGYRRAIRALGTLDEVAGW